VSRVIAIATGKPLTSRDEERRDDITDMGNFAELNAMPRGTRIGVLAKAVGEASRFASLKTSNVVAARRHTCRRIGMEHETVNRRSLRNGCLVSG
jgi:hypothetical protein